MTSSRLMQDGRDAKRIETPFNLAMTGSRPSCNIASACHRRSDTFPAMSVFSAQQFLPENDQKATSVPMTTRRPPRNTPDRDAPQRSEEHTSELQSLMRISYAVFCLKKKQNEDITYNMSTT